MIFKHAYTIGLLLYLAEKWSHLLIQQAVHRPYYQTNNRKSQVFYGLLTQQIKSDKLYKGLPKIV